MLSQGTDCLLSTLCRSAKGPLPFQFVNLLHRTACLPGNRTWLRIAHVLSLRTYIQESCYHPQGRYLATAPRVRVHGAAVSLRFRMFTQFENVTTDPKASCLHLKGLIVSLDHHSIGATGGVFKGQGRLRSSLNRAVRKANDCFLAIYWATPPALHPCCNQLLTDSRWLRFR